MNKLKEILGWHRIKFRAWRQRQYQIDDYINMYRPKRGEK